MCVVESIGGLAGDPRCAHVQPGPGTASDSRCCVYWPHAHRGHRANHRPQTSHEFVRSRLPEPATVTRLDVALVCPMRTGPNPRAGQFKKGGGWLHRAAWASTGSPGKAREKQDLHGRPFTNGRGARDRAHHNDESQEAGRYPKRCQRVSERTYSQCEEGSTNSQAGYENPCLFVSIDRGIRQHPVNARTSRPTATVRSLLTFLRIRRLRPRVPVESPMERVQGRVQDNEQRAAPRETRGASVLGEASETGVRQTVQNGADLAYLCAPVVR